MATSPIHLSSVDDLPANAAILRMTYVNCKAYAEQGETFKANAAAVAFLLAVPVTIAAYAIRAVVCPFGELYHLRFNEAIAASCREISAATTCAAIGCFQAIHLILQRFQFITQIQVNDRALAAANQQIAQYPAQIQAARAEAGQQVAVQIENQMGVRLEGAKQQGVVEGFQHGRAEFDRLQRENALLQAKLAEVNAQLAQVNSVYFEEKASEVENVVRRELQAHIQTMQAAPLADPALPLLQSALTEPSAQALPVVPAGNAAASEDEEELSLKTHRFMVELYFGVAQKLLNCFGSAAWVVEKVINYLDDKCLDGYHPWKEYRYTLSKKDYAAFEAFNAELTNQFANHPNQDVRALNILFEKVQLTIIDQRNKKANPRVLNKEYNKALRIARDAFVKKIDQVPGEYRAFVLGKINNPFTSNHFSSYFANHVSWIGREGRNEDLSITDRMAVKLKEIHAGLKKADPKLLAPALHILVNKFKAVFSWFDPLMDTNQPSILGTAAYHSEFINEQGERVQKVQEVTVARTPVPVCKRTTPKENGDQYFEINDIALTPEYVMHLQSLLTQGKNVMVILHLNPMHLGKGDSVLDPNWLKDSQTALKKKEAEWIELFRKLGRQYPDQIKVCLFPLDGPFMDEINENRTDGIHAFLNKFREFCTKDDSDLKLPSFVHTLKNQENISRGDEIKLIEHVINEVHTTYFSTDSRGEPIRTFNADQRRAFLTLFYSRLSEYQRVMYNINWEQRNCKDAWDRTMCLGGPHMADAAKQVNTLQDPKTQDMIVGQTEGPVLAFGKRPVLHGREIFAQSGIEKIEENPNAKFGPIDLSKTGINLHNTALKGPQRDQPVFQLKKFDFHPDEKQSVLPLPSKATSARDYNDQLAQYLQIPFALPRGKPLSKKDISGLRLELKVNVDGVETDLKAALAALNLPEEQLAPYFYATDLFREADELIDAQLLNPAFCVREHQRAAVYSFTTKEDKVELQIKRDSSLNETHKAVTTVSVDLKSFSAHFNIEVEREVPSRVGSPGSPMQLQEVAAS